MPDLTGNLTGLGSASYTGIQQDHGYETDLGYSIMPVAGRTPKFRRIRLHGGLGFRRVRWKASRSGVPPVIPTPTDVSNDLIVSYTVIPSLPKANPNSGGYNWTVEGEYLYVQVSPRTPGTETLPTGGYPFPIAPMDNMASEIISPIVKQLAAAGTPVANIPDLAIRAAGLGVDNAGNEFTWPFTALAPIFTSSNLIGG